MSMWARESAGRRWGVGGVIVLLVGGLAGCVPTDDGGDGAGGGETPIPRVRDGGEMPPSAIIDRGVTDEVDDIDGGLAEDCTPTGADVCNGVDDDCDGVADEGFGVGGDCTSGEGICAVMGSWVCTDDGGVVCDAEAAAPAPAELCNDLDDDCDGQTDEDFSLGVACSVSELSCSRRGLTECAEDGSGAVCGVEPIVVQPELCNAADDDCDGQVDEGIVLGELCEVGVGLCRRGGFTVCGEGGEVVCSGQPGGPREEACNALDDDCDGVPDEDFGGEPCSAGVGGCLREGFRVCTDAGELECNVVAGEPSGEVCNAVDDDCDGTTDEGYAELLGVDCADGLGACRREGETICDPEGGGGIAFEGIRQNVAEDELRAGGFEECWTGLYGENQPAVAQVLEQCDEGLLLLGCKPVDADALTLAAMGERDEVLFDTGRGANAVHNHNGVDWYFNDSYSWGFAAEGTGVSRNSCDTANVQPELRLCWHTSGGRMSSGYRCGNQRLNGNNQWARVIWHRPDGPGVICSVEAAEPAADDPCNGSDDDCDGLIDEDTPDLGEPCEGAELGLCQEGRIGCTPEGVITCVPFDLPPDPETCNGVDDDCDGSTDEDFGVGEPCQVGVGACEREGVAVCDGAGGALCPVEPGAPAADEVCNGLDDDCDGTVDEDAVGAGVVCDDIPLEACQAGITACVDGERIECRPVDLEPGPEFCNAIDDDCDGTVDEDYPGLGEPCGAGIGACAAEGVNVCSPDGGGGLNFAGIRQNVPAAEVEAGGFAPCWSGLYGGNEPIAGILAGCSEGVLLLGCRPVGNPNLTLAAMGQRAEVLTDVGAGVNAFHNHNGVDWYFNGARSWGFAPAGVGVNRNSCDFGGAQGELRMCWHTNGGNVSSGYRCGNNQLNGNNQWERIIYHRPDGPGMVCSVGPGEPADAELCNGLDDDCDGATDEDVEGIGEACFEGLGLCQQGVTRCGEAGLVCEAFDVEPKEEECNGQDDDCDGEVDEELGLGEPCVAGVGACQAEGVQRCSADEVVVCLAAVGEPAEEQCNMIDDDCDGEVDEAPACAP